MASGFIYTRLAAWDRENTSVAQLAFGKYCQPAPWSGGWWQNLWAQAPSYGPLTYVLSAPVLELFGPSFRSAMASGSVFNGFCCLAAMALDTNYSRRAGLWSALFVAASPALLNQRTDYLIDLSLTAMMTPAGGY